MSGPWEKYGGPSEASSDASQAPAPWEKYSSPKMKVGPIGPIQNVNYTIGENRLQGHESPNVETMGPLDLLGEGFKQFFGRAMQAALSPKDIYGLPIREKKPFTIDLNTGQISQDQGYRNDPIYPSPQDSVVPGQPMLQSRPTTLEALNGVPPGKQMLEGLTTPENVLAAPFTGGNGVVARLISGLFAAQGAKGAYDTGKTVLDPNADPQTKRQALTGLPMDILMLAGGGHHALHEAPLAPQGVPLDAHTSQPVSGGNIGNLNEVLARIAQNFDSRYNELARNLVEKRGPDEVMQSKVSLDPNLQRAGAFDPSTGQTTIHPSMTDNDFAVMHEISHALSEKRLKDPVFAKEMNALFEEAKQQLPGELHGMQNVDEFFAEGVTNPAFAQQLKFARAGDRPLMDKMIDVVYSGMGRARVKGSLLEKFGKQAEPILMAQDAKPVEQLGLPAPSPSLPESRQIAPQSSPWSIPKSRDPFVMPLTQTPTRFTSDPSGRTLDLSQLSPAEQAEAMRGPRQYVPPRQGVRPAQERAPIIGESPLPVPDLNPPRESGGPIHPADAYKGAEKQGGQVSFDSSAEAGSVPSARQSAPSEPLSPIKQFEKDSGFTAHPEVQVGGIPAKGLSAEQLKKFEQQGVRKSVELTDRRKGSATEGLTFYVPENATKKQIETAWENKKNELSGSKKRLYSGVEVLPEQDLNEFSLTASRLLRSPEHLKFGSKTGEVDGGQLVNRLMNLVPPAEAKYLSELGIKERFKGGEKTTLVEVDKWVRENGPKVEVRKYGGTKENDEAARDVAQAQHLLDTQGIALSTDMDGSLSVTKGGEDLLEEEIEQLPQNVQDAITTAGRPLYARANRDYTDIEDPTHWSFVAPKAEKDMPGYVEVAVIKPLKREITRAESLAAEDNEFMGEPRLEEDVEREVGIQFPPSHNFPPNTLGFGRGYMETLPNEKKVFHVVEVQSDWAQRARELKESSDFFNPEGLAGDAPLQEQARRLQDPLLQHHESLVLKALIQHAREQGADSIAVSDAETAMMSEGHDLQAGWEVVDRRTGNRATSFPDAYNKQAATEYADRAGSSFEVRQSKPPQEQGMRLHYDHILPNILEKLTGKKGEVVDFGEHGKAVTKATEGELARGSQSTFPRKDLIFRNPDGTPKTSVTARLYDLTQTKEALAKAPYTFFGKDSPDKLFSGIPLDNRKLAPVEHEKFVAALNSKGDSDGAKAAASPSPLQHTPLDERKKNILDNPTASPMNRMKREVAQPGDKLSGMEEARNKITPLLNAARKGDVIVNPVDVIYDMLDGGKAEYNGALMNNIRKPLDDDFNQALNIESLAAEPIRKLVKDGKIGDRESARIDVYLKSIQEGGTQRMIDSGVAKGKIDNILKSLTPAEMKVAEAMRALYDKTFPELQRVAKDADGLDIKHVANYSPWHREWDKFKPEADEIATNPALLTDKARKDGVSADDVLWPGLDYESEGRTKPGSLESRKPKAKTPVKLDAVGTFERYIRDYSHYVSMRKHLKEMGEIVRSDEFRAKYGDLGQDLIMEQLNTTARQGRYRRNAFLDPLRRLSSMGMIAFAPASQLVHLSNIPLAMQRAGVDGWSRGLHHALGEEGQAFLKQNFAETFARGGGEESLVELANHQGKGNFGKAYGNLQKWGFITQRYIDMLNAQATTLGIYIKALDKKGLNGNDFASIPVDRDAIRQARVLARRAVASPIYKDLPPAITSGGSYSRSLFQYNTTFLDQWSNIRYDLAQAGVAKALAGKPGYALAMSLAIAGMMLSETSIKHSYNQAVTKGTGGEVKEDDTYLKALQHEALRRVPVVGQVMSHLLYGELGVPSLDTMFDVAKEGIKTYNAEDKASRTVEGTKLATTVAEALGVPGSSTVGKVVVAKERAEFYKPHNKQLAQEQGKPVEEMSIADRIVAEYQHKDGQEKMLPNQKAKAAERAVANNVKRGSELQSELEKKDRNWLESRGLSLPGFDNKLNYSKKETGLDREVSVYLTEKEMKRYSELLKIGYSEMLDEGRKLYDDLDEKEKALFFSDKTKSVRAYARDQLKKELSESSSISESNSKKRFSVFDK